jgi:hypothetical protein
MLDGVDGPLGGESPGMQSDSSTGRYTLTLKPPMADAQPVPPGFRSVTMYEKKTSYTRRRGQPVGFLVRSRAVVLQVNRYRSVVVFLAGDAGRIGTNVKHEGRIEGPREV